MGQFPKELSGLYVSSHEMKKKIVIKDGRCDNLYKGELVGGRYVAYHVRGMIFSNDHRVGAGSSFDEAVSLVKSHAGSDQIESKPW